MNLKTKYQFLRQGAVFSALTISLAISAHASSISIVNGNFQQSGDVPGNEQVASDQYAGITLTGWTAGGYVVLSTSGGGTLLASPVTASLDGGNILALDGSSSSPGSISQVINGLTIGAVATVSFEMAAGNYFFYPDSLTTEQLEVSHRTTGSQPWRSESVHSCSRSGKCC
jgi:hypothetical protein